MIPFEHLFVAFGMNLSTPGARVAVVRHQDRELDVREVYRPLVRSLRTSDATRKSSGRGPTG